MGDRADVGSAHLRWVNCCFDPPPYRQGIPFTARDRASAQYRQYRSRSAHPRGCLVVLAGFGLIGIRGYIGVVQIATG
jgi:hypothetical protein